MSLYFHTANALDLTTLYRYNHGNLKYVWNYCIRYFTINIVN